MARKDPLSRAQEIEEQIKKLQEKQRKYIEQAQKEIGQYLMETWDIRGVFDPRVLKFCRKIFSPGKRESEIEFLGSRLENL